MNRDVQTHIRRGVGAPDLVASSYPMPWKLFFEIEYLTFTRQAEKKTKECAFEQRSFAYR